MRITSNTFPERFGNQLQDIQQRVQRDQNAIASGQRISVSSDDPAAFRRGVELQNSQRRIRELSDTTTTAQNRATANYNSATQLQTLLSRASEIAVRANGILAQSDLNSLSEEMNSLLERAVALSNSQDTNGQFLFGGTYLQPTDTDPVTLAAYKPFSVTRNASNQITAVTYRGNQKVTQLEIQTSSNIDFNVLGSSTTGTPRGLFVSNTTSVFTQLITLRDQMLAGNVGAIQASGISNLKTVQDSVAVVIGTISANLDRLKLTQQTHSVNLQAAEGILSKTVDTDLAGTVVSLQQKQTTFQAALQSGSQILNLSLLDYL